MPAAYNSKFTGVLLAYLLDEPHAFGLSISRCNALLHVEDQRTGTSASALPRTSRPGSRAADGKWPQVRERIFPLASGGTKGVRSFWLPTS
jgi:hypothetical protein